MKTQEKIQLIEALTKVVNANRVTNNDNMVDWANKEIKELTESMTKSKYIPDGDVILLSKDLDAYQLGFENGHAKGVGESLKPSINLNKVEGLLVRFSEVGHRTELQKNSLQKHWREQIGYTLDDLK